MKIRILSDLHLEFGSIEITKLPEDKETILILAGDIHVGMRGCKFVDKMCEQFKEVIYILGNHEFYHNHYETILDNWKYVAKNKHNLHVLEDDYVIFEDVLFMGGTMWTDVNEGDWLTVRSTKRGMNDFNVIQGFDIHKSMEMHYKTKCYFTDVVKLFPDHKVVAITHHLPVKECISPAFVGHPLNPGFVSTDLEYLLKDVDLWVYGHTHLGADLAVGDTRLVCNPRGYQGYEHTTDYDDTFTVEI